MKLLIDVQGAQSQSARRGIGRYTRSFVRALLRNRRSNEIIILYNKHLAQDFIEILKKEDFVCSFVPFEAPLGTRWLDQNSEIVREKVIDDIAPDVVLLTSLFEGIGDFSVTSVKSFSMIPTAVIFYDLIPLIYKEYFFQNGVFKEWYLKKLDHLRKADLLLAISESAKQEGIKFLDFDPKKIVTISSAMDKDLASASDFNSIAKKFAITKPYILHVSACDERKNFKGLLQAFARLPKRLRSQYQLVFVCNAAPWQKIEFLRLAKREGLDPRDLVITGYVDDKELFSLYRHTSLFVFPSFHEGFGLPVLEAMRMGTVVIGSNTSSIPEIIACEDALFDPFDIEQMSFAIQRALQDQSLRKKLLQNNQTQLRKFDWDITAQKAWDALLTLPVGLQSTSQDFYARLCASGKPNWLEKRVTSIALANNEEAVQKV